MSDSRTAPDTTLDVTEDPIPATQPVADPVLATQRAVPAAHSALRAVPAAHSALRAVPAAPSALRASGSSRGASPTEAVITEAEVLFATAAAAQLPRERTRRRFLAVLHHRLAIWADARGDRQPRPQPLVYLEGARMARAMEKL